MIVNFSAYIINLHTSIDSSICGVYIADISQKSSLYGQDLLNKRLESIGGTPIDDVSDYNRAMDNVAVNEVELVIGGKTISAKPIQNPITKKMGFGITFQVAKPCSG